MARLKISPDGTTEVQADTPGHGAMEYHLSSLFAFLDRERDRFSISWWASSDPECAKMVADKLKEFSDNLKTACEAMGYGGKGGF